MASSLFRTPTLAEQIESLQLGDHVCLISRGESLTRSVIVPFVRRCLARKEMCFYAIGERSAEEIAAELTQAGIDVEAARAQGSLTLLESREYMPLENFDAAAFVALFRARAQQALDAGFYGVGFAVEMTWALEVDLEHDALIEYETRLNTEFFPNAAAIALCIYDRQRLSAEHLHAALRSHPLAIVDDTLVSDPYYEPPELKAQPSEAARVDWMISQLVQRAKDYAELRRSHDRFRALIENASDGITVVDADGKILYEGPSSEPVMGYKPEELLGRYANEFLSQEDAAPLMNKIRRAIENPEEIQTIRARGRHRDGSIVDLEAVGRRLRDPADPPCVVFNWRDINERVRFEQELERARDAAVEASRLKSAFIANVSHEIRTPLNIITGYIELIEEHLAERNDESIKEFAEGIQRASARLLRTIGDILDISKIESGGFSLAPTRLEIGPLLERFLVDFRVTADRKGIALTCTIEVPGASVVFDEYCLTQALTNLLDNSIKFTDRGAITCRLYRTAGGTLCLEIRDMGIRISEEYLPHLFEPFSQERSDTGRQFQVSGLGLALTRKYLELNGARISVQTEKGKGTTFIIHFSPESEAAERSNQ
jgi:PAS domain S-box-containing protein